MSTLVPKPPTGHRIDEATFVRWWAILHTRYARTPSQPSTELYRTFLDEHLSTADFDRAARLIFEGDTWWPSPRRFVEVLQGDLRAYALNQWRLLMQASKGDRKGWDDLPEHTRTAVRKIGGLRALELMEGVERPYYERHFIGELTAMLVPESAQLPALPSADE